MFARFRVRERCSQVAGGVKALLAFLLTIALALADYYDAVPLQPVLQQLFGEHAAAKLTLFLPIIFGTLRYISINSHSWHHHEDRH